MQQYYQIAPILFMYRAVDVDLSYNEEFFQTFVVDSTLLGRKRDEKLIWRLGQVCQKIRRPLGMSFCRNWFFTSLCVRIGLEFGNMLRGFFETHPTPI